MSNILAKAKSFMSGCPWSKSPASVVLSGCESLTPPEWDTNPLPFTPTKD